uniref:CaMBD domain-containing protein n=1 Tax=Parastrongyloides trichosuri TaxID=131310 RepID=A0A0N4Z1F5_PARTI
MAATALRSGILADFSGKSSKITLYSSKPLTSRLRPEDNPILSINQHHNKLIYGHGYARKLSTALDARKKFLLRQEYRKKKLFHCKLSLSMAILGLILTIIDVEISSFQGHLWFVSFWLRIIVIISTLSLDVFIILYHFYESKLIALEAMNDNWSVGCTRNQIVKVIIELVICSICPPTIEYSFVWPNLNPETSVIIPTFNIPLNVLISFPMFLRLYLLARYLVYKAKIYTKSSTRTVAILGQVSVNFSFVIKSALFTEPMKVISLSILLFWISAAWMLTQCERYAGENDIKAIFTYCNFIWFEIVTFFSIGYGDIQVKTYCGRGIAISTGIVGAVMSSLMTVIMGRSLLLTLAEKRVNQVVSESQLQIQYKNAAATVLQSIWRITRCRIRLKKIGESNIGCGGGTEKKITFLLRMEQRKLLSAILEFRKLRWRLRKHVENIDELIVYNRVFSETQEKVQSFRRKGILSLGKNQKGEKILKKQKKRRNVIQDGITQTPYLDGSLKEMVINKELNSGAISQGSLDSDKDKKKTDEGNKNDKKSNEKNEVQKNGSKEEDKEVKIIYHDNAKDILVNKKSVHNDTNSGSEGKVVEDVEFIKKKASAFDKLMDKSAEKSTVSRKGPKKEVKKSEDKDEHKKSDEYRKSPVKRSDDKEKNVDENNVEKKVEERKREVVEESRKEKKSVFKKGFESDSIQDRENLDKSQVESVTVKPSDNNDNTNKRLDKSQLDDDNINEKNKEVVTEKERKTLGESVDKIKNN